MDVRLLEGGNMGDLPEEVELPVPHVAQKHNWDCGLACTLMTLKYMDQNVSDFETRCKGAWFKESVWTIDIAYLLHSYNISHKLCTITLGVDKGYENQRFYKSLFTVEEKRVKELFDNAHQSGVLVQQRSVQLNEILHHLAKGNIAIVLVDWCYLHCNICSRKCPVSLKFLGSCMKSYQGHFIVIFGYNLQENVIYYRNPSSETASHACCISLEDFDTARTSYGTDEDILFVYKEERPP